MKERTELGIALGVDIMKIISYLCISLVVGFAIYGAVTGFSSPKIVVIVSGLAGFVVFQILYRVVNRAFLD